MIFYYRKKQLDSLKRLPSFLLLRMKIAHTADWHLMQYHLGVSRRGKDFTDAALDCVNKAADSGAVALIHGGDILNTQKAASQDFEGLAKVHELAKQRNIPIFAIEGNHDKSSPPWSALAGSPLPDFLPDDLPGGLYDITGKHFAWRSLRFAGLGCNPASWVKEFVATARSSHELDVIVWHGAVKELIGFPSDEALCLEELDLTGLSAFLLGDIHIRDYLEKDGCVIGYPGATEVIKYKDPTEHSVTIFDTTTRPWSYSHVPIKSRKTLAFRISTEAELHDAMTKAREVSSENPIIFGRYSRELDNVTARFNSVLDPDKAIVRLKPLPPIELLRLENEKPSDWRKPDLGDTLARFFPEETYLSELALRLCQNLEDPGGEMEQYIQQRKLEAEELENKKLK